MLFNISAGKCCTSKRFLKNEILLYSQSIWTSETAQVWWSPPRHARTNLFVHTCHLSYLSHLSLLYFGPPGASRWSAAVSSRPAWGLSSRSPTTCAATACVRTPGKVLQMHANARSMDMLEGTWKLWEDSLNQMKFVATESTERRCIRQK